MVLNPPVRIDGLFVGRVGLLPGESRGSAIAKQAVGGPARIDRAGLAGDEHADVRVHGGPEKAVHLFPAEHYATLAAVFPEARHLVPGGLGENVSVRGLNEATVCIGDVFACGGARLQVAQPRTPCWKIDARCGVEGMAAYVAAHGCAGWYFRVLEEGSVSTGDALVHIARSADPVSLAEFWRVTAEARPPLAALERLLRAEGLAAGWIEKLAQRIAWLRANGAGQ